MLLVDYHKTHSQLTQQDLYALYLPAPPESRVRCWIAGILVKTMVAAKYVLQLFISHLICWIKDLGPLFLQGQVVMTVKSRKYQLVNQFVIWIWNSSLHDILQMYLLLHVWYFQTQTLLRGRFQSAVRTEGSVSRNLCSEHSSTRDHTHGQPRCALNANHLQVGVASAAWVINTAGRAKDVNKERILSPKHSTNQLSTLNRQTCACSLPQSSR